MRNVQSVINSISNVEVLSNGATGLLNANSLNSLKTAVSGLSKEQALLVLSTKNLTQAQTEQILVEAGIIASNDKINASIVQRALAESTLTAEQQKDILTKLELINVETGEVITTNACTKAALEEVLAKKGIVGADAEAIISSMGLTSANATQTISFDLLTASIWANIKALGKWLVTNPIGWAILGGTAIFGLVKAYDALTDSTEEVKERTDALLDSYNSAISEANSNAKTIESLASRYEILSKGVNNLGENVSLTADEYSEYNDIVNQIAEMFPTMITGYTDEGNAILSLKGNVEELRDAYKEAQKEAYNLLIVSGKDSDGNDIITNYQNQLYGNESFLSKTSSYIDGEAGAKDAVDVITRLTGALTPDEFRKTYNQLYKEYENVWNSDKIQDALKSSGFEELTHTPKWSEITTEDLAKVKYSAQATIQTYQAEIDSQLQNVRTLANAYLMTNSDYEKLDEQSKTAASLLVNSIDESIANSFENKSDVGAYVAELITSISNNAEAQKALTKLFTMDTTNMSVGEIQSEVDSYVSTIATAIGEDPVELKVRLGFDDTDTKPLIENVKKKLKGTEFDDKVGELSLGDLKIAADLEVDDDTIQSWDDLTERIEKVKSEGNETDILFSGFSEEQTKAIDDFESKLKTLYTTLLSLKDGSYQESSFADLVGDFPELQGQSENLEQAITDLIYNSLQQLYGLLGTDLPDDVKNSLQSMADSASGVAPSLDKAYSAMQKIYDAKKEFKEAMDNNAITESVLNSVAGIDEKMSSMVAFYHAGLVSEQELYDALQEHYNADLNNYKNAIIAKNAYSEEFYNSVGLADADFINQFKEHYKVDLENCKTYAQAKLKIETETLQKVSNNWKRYYDIQTDTLTAQYKELENGARGGDAYANQILDQINKYREMMSEINSIAYDGFDDIEASFKGISSTFDKNNNKDTSSKNSKQTIDWISRLLDVLQKKIDQTKAKFENLFTLKDKKNNLQKQIKYTKELLEANEKSADRYLKAANKVKLSDDLKKKVRNGSYDINEYDSDTADKINKYKEYWDLYKEAKQNVDELTTSVRNLKEEKLQLSVDKAESKIAKSKALAELDAGNYKKQNKHLEAQKKYLKQQYDSLIKIAELNKDSVEVAKLKAELQKELNDLTMEEFNNIVNTYDNKLGLNDSKLKSFQDQISLLEARGQLVGSALYTKQMSLNNSRSKILQNELNRLVGQLAEIKKNSDDWYNAQEKLFGVKSALVQVQIENANLQKSINDLKFDRFDELINRLNDVVDEANFLKDMLSDNLFDDNGMITDDGITAMGLSAQNYDVYLAEAEKYKEQIAELNAAYQSGSVDVETYESKMREYRNGQQSAIKSANDMKKAIVDLVKQGLDAQNQALEKAVSKQKELLQSEKDLYDFQRKIADQNKNIVNLRKQINALEGDDSEENRKKLQLLKSDLAKAEQEQKDTLYDRSVSDQEKALDDMLANAKEQTEAYLSDSEKVFSDSLNFVNSHTEQVSRNLEKISSDLGYDISENITNAWKNGGKAVDSYENILKGSVPNITAQIILIKSAWEEATLAAERAAEAIVKAVDAENKDLGSIGKETGSTTQTATPNGTTTNSDNKSDGGSILPGALGVFDSVIKKTTLPIVEQFIKTNKQKAKKDKSKYSPLNQYIYDKENGYVLSEENERKLGELLKVSLPSNTFGKEEKTKILDRLKLLGYSKGGVISDIRDAIRLNGDKVLVSANPGERMLTEKQNEYWEKWTKALPNLVNTNLQYKPYIPDFQSRNMQSPVYNIDSSITVEGVATNEIVKDMERVATKQAENVVAKINSMSYAKGVRRR